MPQDAMPDSDLIAYAAALVALLSALYARHTRDAARRTNDIVSKVTDRNGRCPRGWSNNMML